MIKHKGSTSAGRHFCRRVSIVLLIIVLMTGLLSQNVLASTPSGSKEEVVYINLNADGSVDKIYVVNTFDLDEDGQIVDYGNYTSVRNLSTLDKIEINDECVKIDAEAGRFDYQGTLDDTIIPWNISIRYYLNGVEFPAEALAGQTGALEIVISTTENTDCTVAFFDNYALQISLSLDMDVCRNVVANDATIASSGDNKQVSFVVLPGKEAELSLTADVTDFTMDGITIAGMKMTMDFEMDESDIVGETDELKDGVSELDDGVGELKDGTDELVDGVIDFKKGTGRLVEGVGDLNDGVGVMYDNMDEFVDGIGVLDVGVADFAEGIEELCAGADDIAANTWELGNGAMHIAEGLGDLTSQNDNLQYFSQELYNQMLAQDNSGITVSEWLAGAGYPVDSDTTVEELNDYLSIAAQQGDDAVYQTLSVLAYYKGMIAYMDVVAELEDGALQIANGVYYLADGSDSFADGLDELYDGVDDMSNGTGELYDGAVELQDGIGELEAGTKDLLDGVIDMDDGMIELYDGIVEMDDGVAELKDGTTEFREEIQDIDATFANSIHDKLDEMLGVDFQPVSFVDERNGSVEAVQFVMKTSDIEIPDTEEEEYVEQETITFWQRFLALFGRS